MILLDTNAALWVASASSRLGPSTMSRLEGVEQVCYSSVLAIEVAIKTMTGRLLVSTREAPQILERAGLSELPVTSEHALGMVVFPELSRHDPFDRLMMAQASVEGAVLVTSDRHLLGLGYDWVVDARA